MPRCRSLSQPYDTGLSRMLITYVATGLGFMLLPGTLVGVLNLFRISAAHDSHSVSPAWVQAHGHAQLFGWLGTFILGIGFYVLPRLRLSELKRCAPWVTYALWTSGVVMRWLPGNTLWHWRVLMPLGAAFEAIATIIFFCAIFVPARRGVDDAWQKSLVMIGAAAAGFIATMLLHLDECLRLALHGDAPVFENSFNQGFLVAATFGFIVPFIWGFATRWLPPLLGFAPTRKTLLVPSIVVLFAGVALAAIGQLFASAIVLLVASAIYLVALRIFEPAAKEPKLRGVHPTIGIFVRLSFAWMVIAAVLFVVATMLPMPNGFVGASRHALTVGFFSVLVLALGPRVLPAFFGVVKLFSTRLMFAALLLANIGCTLRVTSQILAYQGISAFAWHVLPVSAVIEMTALTIFTVNMLMTLRMQTPMEVLDSNRLAEA